MPVKDLLVHVDTTRACAKRLGASFDLARRHSAHVTGLYVREQFRIPTYAEVHLPAELMEAQQEAGRKQARDAEAEFLAAAEKAKVPVEWQCIKGEPIQVLDSFARQMDLTVVGQMEEHEPQWLSPPVADRLALEAGGPLLIIPDTGDVDVTFGRILLAWDGSREASRAVRDALPFLTQAEEVKITTVDSGEDEPGAADQTPVDIGAHLDRHGVRSTTLEVRGADRDAGELLLAAAGDMGASLIVMGAYGHSRFRELVLGGATRYLIYNSTVPVLMSH
jgi:nucleotide-binding universal stress UspA family protein